MLAHALTFAGLVFPLANLLAPALVGWWNRESVLAPTVNWTFSPTENCTLFSSGCIAGPP